MTKTLAIAAGLLAVSAANAVTFVAGSSSSSAPKFTTQGSVVKTKSASQVGSTYNVNDLPFAMSSPGGNFSWDFYALADAGKKITGVTFTFTYTGGAGAKWSTTTNAKGVIGNSEYSVASVHTGLATITSPAVQSATFGGNYSKYHFYITDTFLLPAGATLTGITATVNEAVPEPASIAALAIGGLGLLGRRRRKA